MNPNPLAAAPQAAAHASGYDRHIRACNLHDSSRFRPFFIGKTRLGSIRNDVAARLAAWPELIRISADTARLNPLAGPPQETLDALCAHVAANGGPRLRGERYALGADFTIDRGMVSTFGARAVGVHLNGFVRRDDGLHLWIGARARDKAVCPGQRDNLVAGGQPAGLSVAANLAKEAAEEAAIPPELIARARPVGMLSYRMEVAEGLRDDLLYIYDLELPAEFVPHNTDGEMEFFDLLPIDQVMTLVRTTDDAKFNVNLVLIDFFIRHGLLGPEHPEYVDLALGLRRGAFA